MHELNLQLRQIHTKVDALHQIVEQLNHRVDELFDFHGSRAPDPPPMPYPTPQPAPPAPRVAVSDAPVLLLDDSSDESEYSDLAGAIAEKHEFASMQHKDILLDSDSSEPRPDYNHSEQPMTPDVQIRRLTAQVTAAYNRIAALEEQLLAQRSF